LIDDIIGHQRHDLLGPLVLAVVLATRGAGRDVLHADPSALQGRSAAHRGAAPDRAAHIGRLPVAYYDANKSGAMVSAS